MTTASSAGGTPGVTRLGGGQRARREGPQAGEELVEHDAKAEHVAVVRERLLLDLLRRHVGRCAEPHRLHGLAVLQIGGAEIADLDVGALADHDVGGLDVAMHDAALESIVERAAALERDFHRAVDRQKVLAAHIRREISPWHVLHDDVPGLVGQHRVVDGDDVRMVELAGERSLDLELRPVDAPELRMLEVFRLDDLERHIAASEGVARQINSRGGALAERLHDLVFADAVGQQPARNARGLLDLRLANDFLLFHPRAEASEPRREAL